MRGVRSAQFTDQLTMRSSGRTRVSRPVQEGHTARGTRRAAGRERWADDNEH
jgi:hypothetical protein